MSVPQDPLVFLLKLITIGPCGFNCMSQKAIFLYTGCHSKLCHFYRKNAVFMSTNLGSLVMPLGDFGSILTTSDNKQWTAGDSGPPGLSGCHGSSLCWDLLFFCSLCYWTLPPSSPFLLCFPGLSTSSLRKWQTATSSRGLELSNLST
jgi:hypothetical protein